MALVKYGPVVSDARGSVGGIVLTRSRAGAVIRVKSKAVVSPTNKRTRSQSIMSQVYNRWLNVITQSDRDTWAALASTTLFTNKLGQSFHLSSYNLYFRTVALQLRSGGPIADVAPPTAFAARDPYAITFSTLDDEMYAKTIDPPTEDYYVFFNVAGPFPPTINFFRGHYTKDPFGTALNLSTGISLSDPDIVVNGQRWFVRDRFVHWTGEVSSPFFTTVDVLFV